MTSLFELLQTAEIHEFCLPMVINGKGDHSTRLELLPRIDLSNLTNLLHSTISEISSSILRLWQHFIKYLDLLNLLRDLDPEKSPSLQNKILLFILLIRNRTISHRFITRSLLFKWAHQILSTCLSSLTGKKMIWSHSRIDSIQCYYSPMKPFTS